jgi:Predicted transcriptional regulator
MQINRLFEIVYILLDKKSITANELAEHFEVSRRTILRDIDKLSSAGIPVYSTPGKGGGISILDSFVLNKTVISEEEQNQIIFALQSFVPTQSAEAGDILSRLSALFDKKDMSWIEVDFSRWGDESADREKFDVLKKAILEKRGVSFKYPKNSGEFFERHVYPLKLIFKSKAWYVQAYCLERLDYRTFKISRIQNIKAGSDSFAGKEFMPPPINETEVAADSVVHLVLRFAPEIALGIYDEFNPEDIRVEKDGSCIVEIDFPHDYWLYSFILSFGASVEVIEPENVRVMLVEIIENMRGIY